ncbi:MAG: alpha/beta fold hydrolase [Alphaproteobacteria bacterium]|nr:alpha/beta fold hydrolase [Alphaproteobacteria bacterium]
MEERVTFPSAGLQLTGVLHKPDNLKPGEKRAAVIVLHGFGGTMGGPGGKNPAPFFCELGYVVLRFDFRGCGESQGERGRVICLEEVEDARNALSWLATRPEVDGGRIALMGESFGAAVAIYGGGVDPRVAAVISSGGWGNGEKKFRRQHPGDAAWARFTKMIADGQAERARTGKTVMVPRYDIVPIPEKLRGLLPAGSITEFPLETVESMMAFNANDVVGKIAPRPLLLLHSARDSVTPTEQSVDLFNCAGQPTDLHLMADVDHFMFSHASPLVADLIGNWLDKHLPAQRP